MAATMRMIGAGSPPLHRSRVGLEFRAVAARISQLAAFVEVAHRVGGVEGVRAPGSRASRTA